MSAIAAPATESNRTPNRTPNRNHRKVGSASADVPRPPRKPPISQRKKDANKKNAQLSTGPKSKEGKKKVSQNAKTHGLTVANPPFADPNYETRLYELQKEHRPTTPSQHYLVEQLAHLAWKLDQVPQVESILLAEIKATTNPNASNAQLLALQFLAEKPTPLTRLWDLQRRLQSQFQSLLRQIPKLKKEAQQRLDEDEAQAQYEKAQTSRKPLEDADLEAHNARCHAKHQAQYNLPDDHPAAHHPSMQNKPTHSPGGATESSPGRQPGENPKPIPPSPEGATDISPPQFKPTNPTSPDQSKTSNQSQIANRKSQIQFQNAPIPLQS